MSSPAFHDASANAAPLEDVHRQAAAQPEALLPLIAERVLLSALREQDAADAAEHARERAQFLSDASLRFGASLDQELTYAAISGIALPSLDAWCVVDVVEAGGALRRLAVLHPDESKQAMARSLAGEWVPAMDDIVGVPALGGELKPVLVPRQPDDFTPMTAHPDTRRALASLGAGAMLVVPIIGVHALLGAITFVARQGATLYAPEDVALAQGLAERCAQALESARLYATARAALAEADVARGVAEAARAETASANESKAHFLRSMSHELRTPLNAIAGYAQLLEMGIHGPVTPQQRTDLASIRRSQIHLTGLVDTVLNYAQIAAGKTTYAITDAPFCEMVRGVEALIAPQIEAKHVHYTFVPCDKSLVVRADVAKVSQVILNLLGNATKFTPASGRITMTCGEGPILSGRPKTLYVRVTDTGVGIPAHELERVFDPFVQVDRRLTSSDVGVGLGLAISRDLARGMGGDLTAESVPGEGSTFTLTLPRAGSDAGPGE